MKNFRIALLLLMTAAACIPDKKKDPEPDLAGTYQVTQITLGTRTVTLPANGVSAVVIVSRLGENQITYTLETTVNGQKDPSLPETVDIQKSSGKDYNILSGGTRIGSINGTDFSLEGVDDNGQRVAITARK